MTAFNGASDIDFEAAQESMTELDTDDFLAAGLDDDTVVSDVINSPFDSPSTDVIGGTKTQSTVSKQYEKKAKKVLSRAFHFTVQNEKTVADAAAILYYEKDLTRASGDLAAENETMRNVLDFLTEGSENPVAAFMIAAAPLAFQVIRNHENFLEPKPRGGIRIPFTKGKKILGGLKLGIRLGHAPRAMTHDPQRMTDLAFGNPGVIRAMQKAGLIPDDTPSTNGRAKRR